MDTILSSHNYDCDSKYPQSRVLDGKRSLKDLIFGALSLMIWYRRKAHIDTWAERNQAGCLVREPYSTCTGEVRGGRQTSDG